MRGDGWFRWNSCERKTRFTNRRRAERTANRLNLIEGFPEDPHPLHVYRCRFCSGYHVGHSEKQDS